MSTTTASPAPRRAARGRRWLHAGGDLGGADQRAGLDALVGGYTALAARVLIFGLVAMALNFLLGFTGVMSFGHAAYFGLGAYGAGLTLRYCPTAPGSPC